MQLEQWLPSFPISLLKAGRQIPPAGVCSQGKVVFAGRVSLPSPWGEDTWKGICQVAKQAANMSWSLLYFLFPSLQTLSTLHLIRPKTNLLKSNQFHVRWWQMNIISTTLPVHQCCVGVPGSLHCYNAAWTMGFSTAMLRRAGELE